MPRPTWTRYSRATTSTPSSSAPRPSCMPAQAIATMRAGKHVQVEIPLADSWADAQAGRPCAAGDRPGRHGRAHPPVQPVAPVDPPPDRRGRAVHPADGRADLLLPAHEHERARASPAAGPTTCSGTTPRTPSTCSSTRPARTFRSPTPCRGRSTPSSASRWTCRSSCARPSGRDLHPVAELQQRRAARDLLPLHLRQRHLHRPLRRPGHRATKSRSTCPGSTSPSNGIELQDREFVAAIREGREPNSSVRDVLPCYRVLGELDDQLAGQR